MSRERNWEQISKELLIPVPPRVGGIDDWAWRPGTRYGTIICDLERNRVIDLLPDRNAASFASWLVAAEANELHALAKGIRREIDAVRIDHRGEEPRLSLARRRSQIVAL